MSNQSLVATLLVAGLASVAVACTSRNSSFVDGPVSPSALVASTSTATRSDVATSAVEPRTHGERLTAILGSGSGIVNVTPTASADGFSAEITVSVHGAPPDLDFYVQRAPEIGRANSADGVCQRAAGTAPWGPPAPNFVTFPAPLAGPLVTLHTSAGGAGEVHISFPVPTIADGTRFDVMFRLVDNLTAPANDLRTECFTVTAK